MTEPIRYRTAEQLRGDIDSGRTGDKVPVADPALAPLGTDSEASGVRVPLQQADYTADHAQLRRRGPGHSWILIAGIVFIAVLIIIWQL